MIDGNFLRRIERRPDTELSFRTDLLTLQFDVELNWLNWINLVYPPSHFLDISIEDTDEFNKTFMLNVTAYTDAGAAPELLWSPLPYQLSHKTYNRDIFHLCLMQRCRVHMNKPAIYLREEEWIDYLILKHNSPQEFERFMTNAIN